jgi:hypothetical protein
MRYYLDIETGQIVLTTDDSRMELERIYDEIYGEGDEPRGDFEAALARRGLPDWLASMVREADQVEQGYGTRYIAIPGSETHESYDDMAAFVETVSDARFHNRLAYAIQGRGAFRRFKDVLLERPAERERWFEFSAARERERLLEWLKSEGIEVIARDKE